MTPSTKSGSLATPKTLDTVDRIFENALTNFALFGYRGASIRDITLASKVTKPTLYYYFTSKEGLYRTLAEKCFEEALAAARTGVAQGKTSTEKALGLISGYVGLSETRPDILKFLHQLHFFPDPEIPDVKTTEFMGALSKILKENVIKPAINSGEIEPEKSEVIQFLIMAVFNLQVCNTVQGNTDIPWNTVVKTLELIMSKGLDRA